MCQHCPTGCAASQPDSHTARCDQSSHGNCARNGSNVNSNVRITEQRFFPVLGNHDWDLGSLSAYLDYFALLETQRYYTFVRKNMRFFALDSALDEPDGMRVGSVQAEWLRTGLEASREHWKIVVMHHPPFSSGHHGSSSWMQWPYQQWGADIVLTGHDHNYERIVRSNFPYLVNGLGGSSRYAPGTTAVAGSQRFYNQDHGALLVEATDQQLHFQFITRAGVTIDTYSLAKS